MCRRWVCVFRNSIQWRTAQASADPHQRVTHSPRTIIITIKLFYGEWLLASHQHVRAPVFQIPRRQQPSQVPPSDWSRTWLQRCNHLINQCLASFAKYFCNFFYLKSHIGYAQSSWLPHHGATTPQEHTTHHQSTYFDPANTKVWPTHSPNQQLSLSKFAVIDMEFRLEPYRMQ